MNYTNLPQGLPEIDPISKEHSKQVKQFLIEKINESPNQTISFEKWMDYALYAPGLGYYVAGNTKLGATSLEGDFTTAPELSPIFGFTLAQQVVQILKGCRENNILEFGAGSGALADAVLTALQGLDIDAKYYILEVSPELKQRQQKRLAKYGDKVIWLEQLPVDFIGCVLANEVLDAMPVTMFSWVQESTNDEGNLHELFVTYDVDSDAFMWVGQAAAPEVAAKITKRVPPYPGYISEINLRAEAWIKQMASWLKQGAAIIVDYGFPQHEYYHPQRAQGTLMCHFRHHAHDNPLVLPGIQDITAHVDFTAMADAAVDNGLDVLGYASQAQFLLNCRIDIAMEQFVKLNNSNPNQSLSAIQKLLSEAEMGELFKVIAIGKNLDIEYPLLGFSNKDRRNSL